MTFMNMNKIKTIALSIAGMALALSCSESIDVPLVDEGGYKTLENNLAFITDKYGCSNVDSLVFNENGTIDFYVNLTQAPKANEDYTLVYDAKVLEGYNKTKGTAIEAMPEALVTIDGTATVAAGATKSSKVAVKYTTASELKENGVYAIPLKVKGASQTSKEKGEFILFVRDISKMPNCHKDNGLQVISCMEVNDANPLHNLCYTLKESKKYVFDQVILFSGNINYNAEIGEVYNYNNENVQHLLDYKEKYLKPLQEKGMKVILGILGNHDRSGVANLSKEGAIKFAQELKAVVEAYELDGVFFDDEYSSYGSYPGFVTPSVEAASRLCYECKRIMPDKLIEVYVYGRTSSLTTIDGHKPGEYIDYALQDYGRYGDLSPYYEDLSPKGMIQGSSEFGQGRIISFNTARSIKTDGYGGTMVFGLTPRNGYVTRLNNITRAFYGEETVLTGSYAKDW
jgi:endo-beta-N-acetylglucosaminidase F1 domain protein